MKYLRKNANTIAHLCWFVALCSGMYIIHRQNVSLFYLSEAGNWLFDEYVKCMVNM